MHRFKRILCVDPDLDGLAALQRAAAVARRNQAGLSLVALVGREPDHHGGLYDDLPDPAELLGRGRQEALEALAQPLEREGLTVITDVLFGRPVRAVRQRIEQTGHDLVVKAARPEQGFREMLLGTLDMRLLRRCPCAMWLVRGTSPAGPSDRQRRVVAAVDVAPHDQPATDVATEVVEIAASMAAREGASLDLLHAWSFPGEEALRARLAPASFARRKQAHLDATEAILEDLARIEGARDRATVRLLKGDPGRVVPEYVDTRHADLVVMGAMTHSRLGGALIGSQAERILRQLDCSVITVRPDRRDEAQRDQAGVSAAPR